MEEDNVLFAPDPATTITSGGTTERHIVWSVNSG
jgi:hypothetical protein